jgi:hypothetical protein
MRYAPKCYWPDVTERELERMADPAGRRPAAHELQDDVACVGALLFTADDLLLCLFEASSWAAVNRASEQLGIPCQRVMEPVWLGPQNTDATDCSVRCVAAPTTAHAYEDKRR